MERYQDQKRNEVNLKDQMNQHQVVKGLFLLEDFITKQQEETLLNILNNNAWEEVVSRRSQQFGRYYNQYKKAMDKRKTIPFPQYVQFIQERLRATQIFDQDFEQTSWLIQEYRPGQGIHPHIDQYGDRVVGINLAAETDMLFSRGDQEIAVPLKRRGLYMLTGQSRYEWKHGIKDVWKRRVSITVRNTIFNENMRKN